MRKRVIRHIDEERSGAKERTSQIVSILASGLERFLRTPGDNAASGTDSLDLSADVGVTTDCQSKDVSE